MGERVHAVVELRDWRGISLPPGDDWMRLTDAVTVGIALDYVADAIGPRVRGMVYRGGYLNNVNTVHEVFVRVAEADRDPESGRLCPRRAVHWTVAEESADDHGRVRRHCTSWQYDIRNVPLLAFTGA